MNDAAHTPVFRQLAKWLVLSVFVLLALLYLYGAVHNAWIAVGSPGTDPRVWFRLAAGQLCFAFALLSFGLGLYKGIQTFPRATGASAALIVLGALLVLGPYIDRLVLMNNCLETGGSWNRVTLECTAE